ncbi:MAG: stage II sporulation protein R [Clostridia bacterium]|nr:stage II sporulation protein R [Clostridia bacterium]
MQYINKSRLIFLFILLILTFSLLITYAKGTVQNISNSVLRLHIVANSNTTHDQELKLAVRDKVLSETSHIFRNTHSANEAKALAKKHSALIQKTAKDEINRLGFDYPINVSVTECAFPTKVYGDIALPSGKYNAVKIEIGKANGENWWCVMYPPLCFTEGTISVPNETKSKLRNTLSQEEYNLVTNTQSGVVPVEVRFKIVEIFQKYF